ncbi:S41 family peptidase [Micromonospora sp. DT62]|uniref:S41 family peptidase n=1 Tax=Micromonospora sp. DT62 TaxID=3416521 RepID=UPI003CE9826D
MNTDGATGGYLRFPTVADDTVVFTAGDDLWRVPYAGGAASRLTAGGAEYAHPRLSPDGKLVAFVGSDDGPSEVYLLPLAGGPARRLTFQAARCVVVGWHPHHDEIIYASTAEQPTGFGYRLFAVGVDGGPTRLLDHGGASTLSYGPGGALVIGRNLADPARRKRYTGGAAGELWVDHDGSGSFTRLALPGNVANPCWVGDRIFLISDHEGTGNVYSCRPDGSALTRHTGHRDFYARGLSTDGQRLVYHAGARLYALDAPGDAPRRLDVSLASSRHQQARRIVPAAEFLDSARLSPDGTNLALVARGKAFTMAHWSGPVRRHGTAEGTRHRLLSWLADGRRLVAVAADDRPDERLVLFPAEGGTASVEIPLTDIGCVTELVASSASGQVAFATNRQQLWLLDTDSVLPTPRLLDSSAFERIEDLAWSPDGRWLAYTFPVTPRTSAIKLAEVALRRSFQVTRPVLRDSRPAFDPAGRYLYFLGQRDLTPEHDQVRFDVGFPFGNRPYLVTLRATEASPFVPRPVDGARRGTEAGAGPPFVEIDLTDIDRRIVGFPVPEGRYASIVGLPDRVLLHTVPVTAPDPVKPDAAPVGMVTVVDLQTAEVTEEQLLGVDDISASPDGGTLLCQVRDRLRVLAAEEAEDADDDPYARCAPPTRKNGWIDLTRLRVSIRPAAEWRQMYRETWRLQRESFWHAEMSGLDWDGLYQRYLPLVDLVGCRSELSDLLWELQGELATSHAYEHGGDYRRPVEQAQGFLGVDWSATTSGVGDPPAQWRIQRILRGDPWNPDATSPCNRPGVDLRPGDAVVAIDGQPVGPAGPGELLVGQADREVELTVLRDGAAPRRVCVRAIRAEGRARYRDWVEGNRALVASTSRGRLGYLHVPDMFRTGYADFIRGFLSELDRDGLVVDVRFNGGGQVSPLLLDRLARRRGGAEHGRWSGATPYPVESPRGPMAVLINEHTGSDGEIFSHMFRQLGLGPLIGNRTWGGTIATWPRHELVDGTVTTQPEFCYVFDGIGAGLENHGVEPDVVVPDPPQGVLAGADPQLAAAVAHLLAGLGQPASARPTARPLAALSTRSRLVG